MKDKKAASKAPLFIYKGTLPSALFCPKKGGCQVSFAYLAFIMKKLFKNQLLVIICFISVSYDISI